MLVNNAARGMRFVNPRFMTDPQPFWEADPDAWRLVIETNIVGVFLMSRAVVPHMLAAGGGSIINVTINHATMVRRGFSPYGPSKAALEAMTTVWAAELEGTGVHINLLAPGGATNTGMIPEGMPDGVDLLEPDIIVPAALHLALAHEQRRADPRHRMARSRPTADPCGFATLLGGSFPESFRSAGSGCGAAVNNDFSVEVHRPRRRDRAGGHRRARPANEPGARGAARRARSMPAPSS